MEEFVTPPTLGSRQELRYRGSVTAIAAVLFAAGAFVSYRALGLSWVTVVFVGLVALGIAGILDALTQRIELHDDRLVIVRNLEARVSAGDVRKAQWSKGVPVSLQTAAGEWVHLPGVGVSSQGLVNTLPAWINKV